MKCGNCHDEHDTPADVKACYSGTPHRLPPQPTPRQQPNPPPSGGVGRRHIPHGWKGRLHGPHPAREEVDYRGCEPHAIEHPDGSIEFTVSPGWFDRNVYRPSMNPVLESPPSQLAENIRSIKADRATLDFDADPEPF